MPARPPFRPPSLRPRFAHIGLTHLRAGAARSLRLSSPVNARTRDEQSSESVPAPVQGVSHNGNGDFEHGTSVSGPRHNSIEEKNGVKAEQDGLNSNTPHDSSAIKQERPSKASVGQEAHSNRSIRRRKNTSAPSEKNNTSKGADNTPQWHWTLQAETRHAPTKQGVELGADEEEGAWGLSPSKQANVASANREGDGKANNSPTDRNYIRKVLSKLPKKETASEQNDNTNYIHTVTSSCQEELANRGRGSTSVPSKVAANLVSENAVPGNSNEPNSEEKVSVDRLELMRMIEETVRRLGTGENGREDSIVQASLSSIQKTIFGKKLPSEGHGNPGQASETKASNRSQSAPKGQGPRYSDPADLWEEEPEAGLAEAQAGYSPQNVVHGFETSFNDLESDLESFSKQIGSGLMEEKATQTTNKAKDTSSTGMSQGSNKDANGRRVSLLEELFPERAARSPAKPETRSARPRISPPIQNPVRESTPQQPSSTKRRGEPKRYGQDTVVVIWRNASRSLTEADFRCLAPKGKHIREWSNVKSDLIKVIPGRDPTSLDHLGVYYLVFPNVKASNAYLARAKEIHRLCKMHTPKDLGSPLLPPPGLLHKGEDINALVKTFTLATPSQKLDMAARPLQFLSPSLRQVINQGGYWPIANKEQHYHVLLKMEGQSALTKGRILETIGQDGRDRGEPWGIVRNRDAVINLQKLMLERAKSAALLRSQDPNGDPMQSDEPTISEGAETQIFEKASMRWLVSFVNETDAKRFTSAWNGRSFTTGTYAGPEGTEVPVIVRAELLW